MRKGGDCMDIKNKILTSSKEAKRITSSELCNTGLFRTSLDGKNQDECELYSDCVMEFALDTYRELVNNPLIELSGYNPDKFDLSIMAAVFSYMQMMEPTIPEKMFAKVPASTVDIIRFMKMDPDYRPSSKEIKEITDRINKLASLVLTIKVTDNRNKKKVITYKNTGNLISASHQTLEENGELIADRWLFKDIPELFRYSATEGINRLRTIGAEYYPALANKTADYLVLKDALALRVNELKKNKMQNPHITYEYERFGIIKGLLADCGLFERNFASHDSWKHKKGKIHKQVLAILDKYKENKIIKDYEVIKYQREICGVKLSF